MHSKTTLKNMRLFLIKAVAIAFILIGIGKSSFSQIQLNEGFTTAVPLPTGWASQNLSNPIGITGWFQGNTAVFNSFAGAPTAYIGANFNNTADGTISNWLFTPQLSIKNGDVFSFYTRIPTGTEFPDRLEVRLNTTNTGVNVGTTETSTGDYGTLLLSINPTLTTGVYPQAWTKFTVTISGVTGTVNGRIAFRYFVEDGGPDGNNSNFIGIDEVQYATPCTGTPTPGNTISSVTTVCSGIYFNLSLQNATAVATYQWQSATAATGPFTDIPGATNATLTTTQTAATFYRSVVTCTASGLSATSTPVQVGINPANQCYCIPGTVNCNLDDQITNVTIGTLNNSSTCGTNGFTNYTTNVAIPVPDVIQGGGNPIKVTVGPGGTEYVGVWVDYNNNGAFETTEFTLIGSANGATISGVLNVPASASLGIHRMRVRVQFNTPVLATQACTASSSFGEVEDYNINLITCVPLAITTNPTDKTVSCGSTTFFVTKTTGSLPVYQWQYRTSSTGTWLVVPNASPYSGVSSDTLKINPVTSALNGYQYRALVSGACAAATPTTSATLTVTPLIATVSPASPTICLGSIQKLDITNPQPGGITSTFTSGTINMTIPDDGGTTGLNNTINVSGIPAGVLINSIKITPNITHSWDGDLIVVVKAPSGNILNLAYALNGTGGASATTAFTPTFSSLANGVYLDGGTNPYNSTFSADGYDATTGDPTIPTGPDGFIPTSTAATRNTFADLYTTAANSSTLNGNWTLALYDYFEDDQTTNKFNSWNVQITYSGFATGVWTSPTPNSLYTDAAATIAYDGVTPISTVYSKPTTTGVTTYKVVVNNGVCTSDSLSVPVTVKSAATAVSAVANKSVCVGNTVSFTATVTGGAGLSYQWKESTDNGATYADVTDGDVYSGSTTNTLTLTDVPLSFNNYKYELAISASPCLPATDLLSAPGTLKVNPNPVIVLSAAPGTSLSPGLTTTITAAVSPNPAATYTWFLNGSPLPNVTGNSIVVDVDHLGSYTVTVNDVNGCVTTSSAIVIGATASTNLFIYPSPTTGQFQVRYFSPDVTSPLPAKVNVFDAKGARVVSKTFSFNVAGYNRMDIDLTNYSKGIYRVELIDAKGNRIKTGTVVVF